MMTVAELIKELQALPQDIQIMMLDSDRESPVEIVQVSRGSWGERRRGGGYRHDRARGLPRMGRGRPRDDMGNGEFIQDDENGDIAVLVTW